MKKRFSLRYKLILIFGLVVACGSLIEGFLAVRIARNAILEKIEEELIDKAEDTAEIINGRATSFLQFIEGIARMPILRDSGVALKEKLDFLKQEVAFNTRLKEMHFIDSNGDCVFLDGSSYSVLDRDWFRAAISGKRYISSPYMSRATGELIATFAVPIYDANRTVVGVLSADISGHLLSNDIADIVIGKTGNCYILDSKGVMIANKDPKLVENQVNAIEQAKTDASLISTAAFVQHVLTTAESDIGYYTPMPESAILPLLRILNP